MKNLIYIFSILIALQFGFSCQEEAKSTNSIKLESPVNKSKAFNKELIIEIEGDSVAGYAFVAEGKTPKETIILVSGYPGNDNNFDIAQEIRRNGKNVVHFNHRGAWGSQGEYSYSNCLEDIEKLIEFLSSENIAAKLNIDTKKFTLLGRSYGAGIALIEGSQNKAVKKIIAISSVNYGEIMKKYKSLDELGSFKKYMNKQIMMNHKIDSFLQELLDEKLKFNILTYKEELANKKILLVEDSNKNQDWINEIENAESIILDSDHNFIDKRIELGNLIVNWLKKY